MDCADVDGVEAARSVKIALLTRYDRLGASSRVRMLLQIPSIEALGASTVVYPLFDDVYLKRLYSKSITAAATARAMIRRLGDLRRLSSIDMLWIEKEALPWLPFPLERFLLPRRVPYALDFDDAVFHRYDMHNSALVRRVLGRKYDHLMKGAALVTAGNAYLAQRARDAGAPRVEVVPTVVDVREYSRRLATHSGACRIGWIGSPSTWTDYMSPMMPVFERAATAADARLVAVGAGRAAAAHPSLESVAWSEETEVASIHGMDIGVMPLTDTPWARGKCGYKLIQYMACGLPVVASPVGVNAEIVEHRVNGFLASTDDEWRNALMTLARDPDLRRSMGESGRRKVEQHYSLQVWGPRVAQLLSDVAAA